MKKAGIVEQGSIAAEWSIEVRLSTDKSSVIMIASIEASPNTDDAGTIIVRCCHEFTGTDIATLHCEAIDWIERHVSRSIRQIEAARSTS